MADAETLKAEVTAKIPESAAADAENNDEDIAPSTENTKEGNDKDDELNKERLTRTLFVGNVTNKATLKDIRKQFRVFGKIENVRIRNVVSSNPKLSKKVAFLSKSLATFVDTFSAYVVFAKVADVDEVMKKACKDLHMTLFMETHIRVMPADCDYVGPRRHSAFIGNLPFDCTEEEMITSFRPIAEKLDSRLMNVRVNRDKTTGIGRGIGFVTLDDDVAVQSLMNMAGEVKVRNNVVRISKARKEQKRNTKTFKRLKANKRIEKKQDRKKKWVDSQKRRKQN